MSGLPLELTFSLVASMLAIAALHALLWRGVRAPYLLWWGAAWLFFAARYLPRLLGMDLGATADSVIFAMLRDLCLVAGASLYAGRAAWRWWVVITLAELVTFALGAATHPDLQSVWAFSRPALAAVASSLVAYALVANERPAAAARRIAAAGYMVFAIDAALAAFQVRYQWRFVFDQTGYLAIGMGLALSLLEEASLANAAALARIADSMRFVLRGRVNVCARCRRVEDDGHVWQRPEVFVGRHTQADISHGICPSCLRVHYADLLDDTAAT